MGTYKDNAREIFHCSFCGKSKSDVEKLVAGTQAHICNECINICIEIVIMDAIEGSAPIGDVLPSLNEVEEFLVNAERFRFAKGLMLPPKNA